MSNLIILGTKDILGQGPPFCHEDVPILDPKNVTCNKGICCDLCSKEIEPGTEGDCKDAQTCDCTFNCYPPS